MEQSVGADVLIMLEDPNDVMRRKLNSSNYREGGSTEDRSEFCKDRKEFCNAILRHAYSAHLILAPTKKYAAFLLETTFGLKSCLLKCLLSSQSMISVSLVSSICGPIKTKKGRRTYQDIKF